MRDFTLAYGHQSWTTATHLERALQRRVRLRTFGPGHAASAPVAGAALLWIESGVSWLPAPADLERGVSAAYLIDTHRGYGWRAALARAFDIAFTAQRPAAERLDAAGVRAEWLPLAAPRDLCGPGADLRARRYDVAFVGQAPPGSFRARLLTALADRVTMAPAPADCRLDPPEMMELYKQARVVINAPIAGDLNMRVFEATGARAVLVTSPVPGLDAVLPASSYVSAPADSLDAWILAIDRVLSSGAESQAAADAAHAHVLAHHTYDHRADVVITRLSDMRSGAIDPQVRRRALAAAWARWGRMHDVRSLGLPPATSAAYQSRAALYAIATPALHGLRRVRYRRLNRAR